MSEPTSYTAKPRVKHAPLEGWMQTRYRAKNVYWDARRDGKTETEALLLAIDDALRAA